MEDEDSLADVSERENRKDHSGGEPSPDLNLRRIS